MQFPIVFLVKWAIFFCMHASKEKLCFNTSFLRQKQEHRKIGTTGW